MDPDIFPNELEYWGPNGIGWFRNVQFRWMPMKGDDEIFVALERPGASGDAGRFADRIELQNVIGRFPAPDVAAHYKATRDWGHWQVAGLLRRIDWEDVLVDQFDLTGEGAGGVLVAWSAPPLTQFRKTQSRLPSPTDTASKTT